MERSSALSTAEIVGVATASAAALGGVIIALGRSQESARRDRTATIGNLTIPLPSNGRVKRGRELARQAVTTVAASYPEVRQSVADLMHRAAATAQPQASRVSSGAAATADQVRTTGASVLERFQEEVLPAAGVALSGLVERAEEARQRSQPVATDVRSQAAAKADVALAKSANAARDTAATFFWAGAALTLIYFALLSPERREQLKGFLWSAFDQAQVLLRDFQGYEEEF